MTLYDCSSLTLADGIVAQYNVWCLTDEELILTWSDMVISGELETAAVRMPSCWHADPGPGPGTDWCLMSNTTTLNTDSTVSIYHHIRNMPPVHSRHPRCNGHTEELGSYSVLKANDQIEMRLFMVLGDFSLSDGEYIDNFPIFRTGGSVPGSQHQPAPRLPVWRLRGGGAEPPVEVCCAIFYPHIRHHSHGYNIMC